MLTSESQVVDAIPNFSDESLTTPDGPEEPAILSSAKT